MGKPCECGYSSANIRGDKAFPEEALPLGGEQITDSQQWFIVDRSKLQPAHLSTEAYCSGIGVGAERVFQDGWTFVTQGYPLMGLSEALAVPRLNRASREKMAIYASIFDM